MKQQGYLTAVNLSNYSSSYLRLSPVISRDFSPNLKYLRARIEDTLNVLLDNNKAKAHGEQRSKTWYAYIFNI